MPSITHNDIRSPSARNDVAERARTVLDPPVKLSPAELTKWQAIVAGRSVQEWRIGVDLHLAAILAQSMALLDCETELLNAEGTVLVGPRGGAVPNPRVLVVTSLKASILRYESRLHFDVGTGSDSTRKAAREAEQKAQARDQLSEDDASLINRFDTRPKSDQDGLILRPRPRGVQ